MDPTNCYPPTDGVWRIYKRFYKRRLGLGLAQLYRLIGKKKLLPPVNWRWVKEGDGYVRHEAWPHTPTVWECGLRRSRTWVVLTLLLTFPDAISWS